MMAEKSMLPTMKSILLNFDKNGDIYEVCQGGTRYLRSTPLLERAEEMKNMLSWLSTLAGMGELSLMTYASPYTDGAIDQAEALNDLLASIKKAEEERGGGSENN